MLASQTVIICISISCIWDRPETMGTMKLLGNQLVNEIWEANLCGKKKINSSSSRWVNSYYCGQHVVVNALNASG